MDGIPFVMLRLDYLIVCEKDYCAAKLLNLFRIIAESDVEEWNWFHSSIASFQQILFFEHGEKSISKALKLLQQKDFIEVLSEPIEWGNNPGYRFNKKAVKEAIDRITDEDVGEYGFYPLEASASLGERVLS